MTYKCRICGLNEVENPGDVCELCAAGQDSCASAVQNNNDFNPQLQSVSPKEKSVYTSGKGKRRKVLLGGGAALNNTDIYGNVTVPSQEEKVQSSDKVTEDNQSESSVSDGTTKEKALTTGITKNLSVDKQKRSTLLKLYRTLFKGIPFTLDDEITMFQVFPNYTGSSLNAMGYACDQVIVYGKLNTGAVSENNDIEIYGHRDSENNIIAKKIVNKSSGTTVKPDGVIPVAIIWGITIAVFIAMFAFISTCGMEGIIWAVILIFCLANLPLILKIIMCILGFLFFFIDRS